MPAAARSSLPSIAVRGPGEPVVAAPGEVVAALGGDLEGAIAAGEGAVRFRGEIEAEGVVSRLTTILRIGSRRGRSAGWPPRWARLGAVPGRRDPEVHETPDAERWLERNDGS